MTADQHPRRPARTATSWHPGRAWQGVESLSIYSWWASFPDRVHSEQKLPTLHILDSRRILPGDQVTMARDRCEYTRDEVGTANAAP